MFMITNLIEPPKKKLILNHLIGNNCPEFRNGLLDSYFFKLNLRSDCLELCFWTVDFKNQPDSVILQKCQSRSNQSFKRNSVHMPSLNLTLSFFLNLGVLCLSLTFTTQKPNACSLWTPCSYFKFLSLKILNRAIIKQM